LHWIGAEEQLWVKAQQALPPVSRFLCAPFAIALEHQIGDAPDVDLGYHAVKATGRTSIGG
jgi:hypothetical protein